MRQQKWEIEGQVFMNTACLLIKNFIWPQIKTIAYSPQEYNTINDDLQNASLLVQNTRILNI